jgi:ribosome recycling factor
MTRQDTLKTLSQCIGLLSIEGENTKEEVKDKLEALRTELVADEMADIEQRVQRAFDKPIEEIEKELPF